MSKWQNFHIWRGRLPHWRADNVAYYVTFRHRRPLNAWECDRVLYHLRRPDGKKWDLVIACVLPEVTELIFRVQEKSEGVAWELSDIVEKAKTKAGKDIVKRSEERYPPFFNESYDRILRDDEEFEEFWTNILESPVNAELVEEPGDYAALFVPDAPQ